MADARYSARAALPVFLTRGRDNAITLGITDSAGDAVTVSSGTIDVWDASGVKIVDGAAVATAPFGYTVLAAVLPSTLALSESFQIGWNLTIGGVVDTFIQPAHLVRWVLSNPVAESDLTKKHPEVADLIDPGDDVSDILTEAWEWVQQELLLQGRMPWRVLDGYNLFRVTRAKAWAELFRAGHAAVGGSGKYLEMAEFYDQQAVVEFAKVQVRYDDDDDGLPDEGDDATAVGSWYLGGPGTWVL